MDEKLTVEDLNAMNYLLYIHERTHELTQKILRMFKGEAYTFEEVDQMLDEAANLRSMSEYACDLCEAAARATTFDATQTRHVDQAPNQSQGVIDTVMDVTKLSNGSYRITKKKAKPPLIPIAVAT